MKDIVEILEQHIGVALQYKELEYTDKCRYMEVENPKYFSDGLGILFNEHFSVEILHPFNDFSYLRLIFIYAFANYLSKNGGGVYTDVMLTEYEIVENADMKEFFDYLKFGDMYYEIARRPYHTAKEMPGFKA